MSQCRYNMTHPKLHEYDYIVKAFFCLREMITPLQ